VAMLTEFSSLVFIQIHFTEFKILGTIVTDTNFIPGKIWIKLNCGIMSTYHYSIKEKTLGYINTSARNGTAKGKSLEKVKLY
jgi:hypothetical protein